MPQAYLMPAKNISTLRVLDAGRQTHAGCRTLDTGLDAGDWTLDAGRWTDAMNADDY